MSKEIKISGLNEKIDSITLICDSETKWHEILITTVSGKKYRAIRTCGTYVLHTTYVVDEVSI